MKKKFLSVLMAGALIATSSVNVFASTNTITGSDAVEHTTNVSITGDIENEQGETKPGTLNVTVPTAAAFTVTKDGSFAGSTIKVTNAGTQNVDVFAQGFTDVTGSDEINVVGDSQLANLNRTNVSLKLTGTSGVAYLGSAGKQTGIYSDKELTSEVAPANAIKLATVNSSSDVELKLEGQAGADTADTVDVAVKDNFTLVLKIKKSTN